MNENGRYSQVCKTMVSQKYFFMSELIQYKEYTHEEELILQSSQILKKNNPNVQFVVLPVP